MTKTSPAHTSTPAGFQGHIKGATLGDLVQMECLAGAKRVVKVTSGGQVGHLFFRAGGVVHAATRLATGEAAALEMLSWDEGTFEPVDREWPVRETVKSTWQSLVLRAAQLRDESRAHSVVALREGKKDAIGESMEFEATPLEVGGHVLRREDFDVVVRVASSGAIAFRQGDAGELADIAAYACRLSQLIGEDLGIERFVSMECTFRTGRCFLVAERTGDVVVLAPHDGTDSASLRELFGL